MPYNDLRKDYLLNRWVVIATERARRPTDFAKQRAQSAKTSVCPMCVGNEHMTPPANLLYLQKNGLIEKSKDPVEGQRPTNWLIRDIPNLYPAFEPPKQAEDENFAFINGKLGNAVGAHEVIVESPNHDDDPATAQLPQVEMVIRAYIDRLKELSGKKYVRYVSIFRNYGQEAGASLSHAHSQITAIPLVPPLIQEEMATSKTYFDKEGKCIFCQLIEREAAGPRLIFETTDFIVFAPYASIAPMAFWIAPKRHSSTFENLNENEIPSFAKTLKTSLSALKQVVNDPPYNYGFHLSIDKEAEKYYHWHLEVYPKLSIWAGFEISTGIFINTVTPEDAAKSLRETLKS